MGNRKYFSILMKKRICYSSLITLSILTSVLTGCDQIISQEQLNLLDETGMLHEKTPAIEVTSLVFSPDDKTFTMVTRMTSDIGPYQLADPNTVRIDVKETVGGIPQHRYLPVLTAARNTEAEKIAATGIKVLAIVDLTLSQAKIDRQQRALADMLTSFSPENFYVSFIYGDSITASVKASEYVMDNYFERKDSDHKFLYRAILQKRQEMESQQAPWNTEAGKLLVVFSDEQVYLDDDLPMDPNHFGLQEQLLKATSGDIETFYVSLNDELGHEEEPAARLLKLFCQNNRGLFLTDFNWLTIKNAMFRTYGVNIDSYEFSFVNPDYKIYRGNHHTFILDFYNIANDNSALAAFHNVFILLNRPGMAVRFLSSSMSLIIVSMELYMCFIPR